MSYTLLNYPSVLSSPGFVVSIADDYAPGSRKGTWSVNDGGSRDYTNRLKIVTSSKYMGPVAILSALPVRLGDIYSFPVAAFGATENDTGSFLQHVELDQTSEDGLQWAGRAELLPLPCAARAGDELRVSGGFRSARAGAGRSSGTKRNTSGTSPMTRAATRWRFPQRKGAPYVNTAGDPLEDPPKGEETRPILRFSRAEAIYNDAYAGSFKDTINDDEFLAYPPGTVKCKTIKGDRRVYRGLGILLVGAVRVGNQG